MNLRWFFPGWNGDLRVESAGDDAATLSIVSPTPAEVELVNAFGPVAVERGWLPAWTDIALGSGDCKLSLAAPAKDVGILAMTLKHPKNPAVLTVVQLPTGTQVALEREDVAPALEAIAAGEVTGDPAAKDTKTRGHKKTPPKGADAPSEAAKAADRPPVVAATVKRPTPCCPACRPGAVAPASEVLLSFLTPEQHARWASERALHVQGGLTGHTYRIAHRHSPLGIEQGRVCVDLTSRLVMHFHDTTVPPEEEVLAAMLILQHREDWLRNEATIFGASRNAAPVYRNPFGDALDGVQDAGFAAGVGLVARRALGLPMHADDYFMLGGYASEVKSMLDQAFPRL